MTEEYATAIAAFEEGARTYKESGARAEALRSALLLRTKAQCLDRTDLTEWLLHDQDELRQVAFSFLPMVR